MRRPLLVLAMALAAVALFTGGLAWLLDTPKPPPGAGRAERLYLALCATCHGVDGRGSWRAALFLIRPGDLTDLARMGQHSDRYLFEIVKQGGAPLGRPGMPGFGFLSDAEVEELVRYVRGLSPRAAAEPGGAGRGLRQAVRPRGEDPALGAVEHGLAVPLHGAHADDVGLQRHISKRLMAYRRSG